MRGASGFRSGVARVTITEFEDEMRMQGVGFTTELEYWAHDDEITIATTA